MTSENIRAEIESAFRTSGEDSARRNCNTGTVHNGISMSQPNPLFRMDAAELCSTLIQEIGVRKGVDGMMKYYVSREPVLNAALALAYATRSKPDAARPLTVDSRELMAVTDEVAADAGATFAVLHQGKKRLADAITPIVDDFMRANYNRALPEGTRLALPTVTDTEAQLKACYKPGNKEDKMACALAGEAEMLKRLGITTVGTSHPTTTGGLPSLFAAPAAAETAPRR